MFLTPLAVGFAFSLSRQCRRGSGRFTQPFPRFILQRPPRTGVFASSIAIALNIVFLAFWGSSNMASHTNGSGNGNGVGLGNRAGASNGHTNGSCSPVQSH